MSDLQDYCQKLRPKLEAWKGKLDQAQELLGQFKEDGTPELKSGLEVALGEVKKAQEELQEACEEKIKVESEEITLLEYMILSKFWNELSDEDRRELENNRNMNSIKEFINSASGDANVVLENGHVVRFSLSYLNSKNDSDYICEKRTKAFKYLRLLPQLTHFFCDRNNLLEIDLSHCRNLTTVNCEYNNIQKIKLKNCESLKHFLCNHNQIKNLELEDLFQLEDVVCNNNSIEVLRIKNCPGISGMNCSNNPLKAIPIEKMPNLQKLTAEGIPLPADEILRLQEIARQKGITLRL